MREFIKKLEEMIPTTELQESLLSVILELAREGNTESIRDLLVDAAMRFNGEIKDFALSILIKLEITKRL